MKPLYLLAPLALLGLASAAPPPPPAPDDGVAEYPPCSTTVTDRCVQTYERGGRRHAMRGMSEMESVVAPPAPPVAVAAGDYPPCTASRQDRCTQGAGSRRAAPTRYAMAERQRIRIGERG
jgi:hypothetical protein